MIDHAALVALSFWWSAAFSPVDAPISQFICLYICKCICRCMFINTISGKGAVFVLSSQVVMTEELAFRYIYILVAGIFWMPGVFSCVLCHCSTIPYLTV